MMKKTTIILSSLLMLFVASCVDSGYKKTASGLMYKIISSDKKAPIVKRGDIIKLHFQRKTTMDTAVISSYGQAPIFAKCDSVGPNYDPSETFPFVRKGDSVIVILEGDTLFKRGALPQDVNRKDKIILSYKVLDVFTDQAAAEADRSKEMSNMQEKQQKEMEKRNADAENLKAPKTKEIEDYLIEKKIKYQKAPLGTFVEVKDPGTGMQAAPGKKVVVRYTGKLFPSGKVFESNMDGQQGYPVVIGTHGVIDGWEEGLTYFKKGGKGTLYVPFYLAYGARPGPGGQPFESLIFDIQIDEVTDEAPAQAPAPPPPTK